MRKEGAIAIATAVVGVVGALANYHVVYGSTVDGIEFIRKKSPSLSETIINMDAINGMPAIAARMKYPLFTSALLRDARSAYEARQNKP